MHRRGWDTAMERASHAGSGSRENAKDIEVLEVGERTRGQRSAWGEEHNGPRTDF